jgi:hypothetical protein
VDVDKVFGRIEKLRRRKILEAEKAEDFLGDILDLEGK